MANTNDDNSISFVLYRYAPSLPAAFIFVAIFAVLAVAHLIRLLRTRTLFFIPLLIGLVFETAGYASRIVSHYDRESLGPYIAQSMLILVAPALYAASIYMAQSRLVVRMHAESMSLVPIRFVTKIFVLGDVVSFLLQCAGGGYMAAGSVSALHTGANIVIGGLFVQLLFFGFFVSVSVVFHLRARRNGSAWNAKKATACIATRHAWESLLWALYAACILIFVRSVFRMVEYIEGNDGFIMRHEYFLYIFDAVLMTLAALVLCVVYPGSFLTAHRPEADIRLSSSEFSRNMKSKISVKRCYA